MIVAVWGDDGRYRERDREVLAFLREAGSPVQCLGTINARAPRYPSRLRAGATPASFAA